MNAFTAMLGTLFNDPNLSVSATYTPAGGSPVAVRALRVNATDHVTGATTQMGLNAQQDSAEVLQSEVPTRPGRGATLALDGRTFRINAVAASARNSMTWRVVLADG